jgi:hypothetical protein
MSLINDALKRASQSEKDRPRDTGSHAAMQPARESRRSIVPMVAGAAVVVLLAAAGWLVWRSLAPIEELLPAPMQVAAKPVIPAPPAKVEPAPVPVPAPQPVVVTPPPNTNPPAPPPVAVVVPPPAPPPFPDLKLQGIFYNRNNPKAAINGQIRRENELVGDVRIVTITPNKVTVEWNGQTKDLILETQ